jgi:putative transposase
MEAAFCVEALEEAIGKYGKREIFNSDQGSQFTSEAFTGVLLDGTTRSSAHVSQA